MGLESLVDINALLSESEIPLAVKLFPTSLFFLVVKGLLRLSSWYPEKDILFRRSNQNTYIKFQNKDNHFQAVHSKLVYTVEKLYTDLPRRKNESKIFVL